MIAMPLFLLAKAPVTTDLGTDLSGPATRRAIDGQGPVVRPKPALLHARPRNAAQMQVPNSGHATATRASPGSLHAPCDTVMPDTKCTEPRRKGQMRRERKHATSGGDVHQAVRVSRTFVSPAPSTECVSLHSIEPLSHPTGRIENGVPCYGEGRSISIGTLRARRA